MNLQLRVEKFREHNFHKAVSLSLIDTLFDIKKGVFEYADFENFEIHIYKYGAEIDDQIKDWFDIFINKNKTKEEISFLNYVLTVGMKLKYERFKDHTNLSKLKELYDIIIFIEKNSEFSIFEYIEALFQNQQLDNLYKLVFFNLYSSLPKKDENIELNYENYLKFSKFEINHDKYQEIFFILEKILLHIRRLDILIKYFFRFSKDIHIYYFLINHKKTVLLSSYIKTLELDDNHIHFLAFSLIFNQYMKFEDELLEYIKKSEVETFYLFLKAIILRFDFYQLNKDNQYLFYLLIGDLLDDKDENFLNKLFRYLKETDFSILAPVVVFILQHKRDPQKQQNLILQIVLSMINSAKDIGKFNLFHTYFQLLHFIVDSIEQYNLSDRFTNLLIGKFHTYIVDEKMDNSDEVQIFFFIVNLFIYKSNNYIKNDLQYKLCKMSIKLFEKYIKHQKQNIFYINLYKIYLNFLNNFLKEHNVTDEIFDNFIKQIYDNFHENDLLKYNQLLAILPDDDGVSPDDLSLDLIGESTRRKLLENSSITKQKLVIYPVFESKAIIFSLLGFYITMFMKATLLYDLLYPLLYIFYKSNYIFKRDKNKLYIFNEENNLINSFFIENIEIKQIKIYTHYINPIVSIVVLIIATFVGFRILLDGLMISNLNLIVMGSGIILLGIILDYFFYYFFIKLKSKYFFHFNSSQKKGVLVTSDPNFIKLF